MSIPNSLNGSYGTFADNMQVNVKGLNGNYVVIRSIPFLVTTESYTPLYFLCLASDLTKGVIVPQFMLTKSEQDEPTSGDSKFTDSLEPLHKDLGAYNVDEYVKITNSSVIYKIVNSFLMLNSDNVSIIGYELKTVDGKFTVFCPHVFLERISPENIVIIEVSSNGSNSGNGSGSDNNSGSGGDSGGGSDSPIFA